MSYARNLIEMSPWVTRLILSGDEAELEFLLQFAYDEGKRAGKLYATNSFLDGFRVGRDRNIEQGAENAGEGADLGQVGQ